MKFPILGTFVLFLGTALAAPSSTRVVPAGIIKNGSTQITVPTGVSNDTMVLRNTSETLTNKTLDTGTNTITGLSVANFGALTSARIIIGNGSNVATATAVTGDVSLSNAGVTAYSGVVPINKGGTNNGSLTTTAGGILYVDGSAVQATGIGSGTTNNSFLSSAGSGTPVWASLNSDTPTVFTGTGATAGYAIKLNATASVAAGCVFSNNSNNYTVLIGNLNSNHIFVSNGAALASSGTLTYVSGGAGCNGAANLTCTGSNCSTAATAMASTTISGHPSRLKVKVVGGGGAGGGVLSAASNAAAGGGGAGGDICVKLIDMTPYATGSTWYYLVGTGGAGGAAAGGFGYMSVFVDNIGTTGLIASGGGGGSQGAATTLGITQGANGTQANPLGSGSLTGCDLLSPGGSGGIGIVLNGTTQACAGAGGSSLGGQVLGSCNGSAAGTSSSFFNVGTGGSGGVQINNGGAKNGGSGTGGVILVEAIK